MGWQRIYLCNTRHGSRQGRTYRPSGAHQITICIGLPHQLLGNNIHHRISIGNNGIQLFVQTVFYDLGKHFTVHFMGFLEAHIL